jgi:PAS domain S-box-containing protein
MNPRHPNELRDRIVAFRSDIPERKRAEEALWQQAQLLHLSYDAILVWRKDGGIEHWNRGAEQLYGFTESEALGRTTHELLKTIHPVPWLEIEAAMRKHGQWEGELRHYAKDGHEVIVSARHQLVIGTDGIERILETNRDVTERKRAEEALRDNEARLRLALDSADAGMWEWDLRTNRNSWTEELWRLYGLKPHSCEPSYDSWLTTVHPDDLKMAEQAVQEAAANGTEISLEYRVLEDTVKVRWLMSRGRPLSDATGKPVRYIGIVLDITQRKEAEIRLEETGRAVENQKNLLQYIIDSAKNSHLVYLDRDFNFVQVNETYARTCGYTPQEMVGKNHFALYPQEENEAIFARVRDTGVPVEFHDKPFVFPDQPERGTTFWDWTLTPVKDPEGAVKGLVFSLFETTHRKRMEDELRKSRDELERRVQERTAELQKTNERLREENQERISTEQSLRLEEARLDALLQLSQISEASLKEITNFALEQAIKLTNSKIGFVGFVNEDESVYTLHAVSKDVVKECNVGGDPLQWHVVDAGIWAEAIREHRTLFVNDYSKPHPKKRGLPPGHPYVERFMVVPIVEGEKIIAVAGVGNKALEYNKSDERQIVLLLSGMCSCIEKNRSREELENAYKELEKSNSELAKYNRQLKALNQELQEFAFAASHDLNEPLRKIHAFGDMVAQRLADFKDEVSKDYLKRMRTAAVRMQTLLNSLRSYSRVTTKAEAMKKTDLRRSVKEALSNLEILIREKNADVEVGELPTIKTDMVQMTQLFQNLIGNALKFQRDGEVPHVKIYAREVGNTYEIYVEDNGIGFDEKYLDKIFQPFQRLHGRSSHYEGVGMGLAICRKIVERHGGKVTARSRLDKGSTFIVTLPASRKAQ